MTTLRKEDEKLRRVVFKLPQEEIQTMNRQNKFKGMIPAMMTPLTNEKKINIETTGELVDFLLKRGVNGLFILGTFGEGMLHPVEERRKFVEKVVSCVNGKVPVIVLASHMEVHKTKELIGIAQDSGANAAALVPPFYYVLSDRAIEKYFMEIFKEFNSFPFFVYNIPGCTINEVNLSTLRNLAESCPNFVALKNSKPSLIDFQRLLPLQDRISIFMGEDSLAYPALLLGANGIVSGPASVFPEPYVRLYREFTNGNYAGARRQQMIINGFSEKLEKTLNPEKGGYFHLFKKALQLRGVDVGGVKEPLPALDSSKENLVVHLVKEFLEVSMCR